jgi:hypothetical protein
MDGKKLTDVSGRPYLFELKDGTELTLGDFTVYSEMWAAKKFGSIDKFHELVVGDPTGGHQPQLEPIIQTLLFLMDESSRAKFDQNEQKAMEQLAKQLTYKHFARATVLIYQTIHDSMPELTEEQKKTALTIRAKTKAKKIAKNKKKK